MQLVRSKFFTQSNKTIDTVVKNTSCSHGWLRLVVQIIFGAITVASFIMILHMAMQRPPKPPARCDVTNCRVQCLNVQVDENEENDVISIVTETGLNCDRIILTLRGFTFDNSTMPLHWMSRMPTHIHVLNIVGGNLRHIPPSAFVGQFAGNIRALSLEGITISQWMSTTFAGLSRLRKLFIKDCVFGDITRNALRAIDDTVRTLTVTHSGKWDPTFITGHVMSSDSKLDTVDFSFNDFGRIIKSNTFKGLKLCKTLFLNSCKITSIAAGAFDPLVSVELLFLNNNLLHTVPAGLFGNFLIKDRLKPRIHLENNPWTCDCLQDDLIQMSKNELLPVDTMCTGPNYMLGKTIADLADHCRHSRRRSTFGLEIVFLTDKQPSLSKGSLTSLDSPCFYGDEPIFNATPKIMSPIAHYQCLNTSFIHFARKILRKTLTSKDLTESDWLIPVFLLQNRKYTAMQMSSAVRDNGILWYQTSCPNEIYCLNTIPNFLRVYNTFPDTEYTFCPFDLNTFEIPPNDCVKYNFSTTRNTQNIYQKYVSNPPFLYLGIGIVCVGLGAMCVYMIIRKNPTLLKGSKRLLFVKHRNVDALVLPPKVPLRDKNSLLDENICSMNDKIFTVPDGKSTLYVNHFMRSNSVQSDKSSTPTYISAMQPTEAQLAEWRIKHHFDKSPSIISISSDISTISWTSDRTSAEITTNVVYESLK